MTIEDAKKIFKKYNINQQVVDSYCGQSWFDYVQDNLEDLIKSWLSHCRRPLSDYCEASNFFMYLTTD